MLKEKEKKKQFDLFIKQKGIEASNYIKNEKEAEDRKFKELHRVEKKNKLNMKKILKRKK